MRIFIDSHDLLDMFNERRPLTVSEFGRLLRANGHVLVVTWSMLAELIPTDHNLIVNARRLVALEEDVPLTFFQSEGLMNDEFKLAFGDFVNRRSFRNHDPYVDTFVELWARRSDSLMLIDLERRLDLRKMSQQVEMLVISRPSVFH